MDYNVLYWLRDAIACLGILVGLGGAIFLFTRKKTVPGILTLVGFLALGLDPLLDIILWRIIAQYASSPNWTTMDYAFVCITGPGHLIGAILIVVAFIMGFREPKLPPPPIEEPADLPPAV